MKDLDDKNLINKYYYDDWGIPLNPNRWNYQSGDYSLLNKLEEVWKYD